MAGKEEKFLPPMIDLHEDISLYYVSGVAGTRFDSPDLSIDLKGRQADLPKYKNANVKLVLGSIAPLAFTTDDYRSIGLSGSYSGVRLGIRSRYAESAALQHFLIYYGLSRTYQDKISLIETLPDLNSSWEHEKISIMISMEGAEALQDAEDIYIYEKLGLRSLQLNWNFDNRYSASCFSRKDYGVTGDGEELIRRLNDLGILLDLAHSSENTVLEATEMSKLPVIVSHTNSKSKENHLRNVSDKAIEQVYKHKGVIGFSCIAPTLSKAAKIEDMVEHIMYVYESFGADVMGIGSDYFGLLGMDTPKGLEDITRLSNLWKILYDNGMKKEDVEKISYGNSLRVIKENLGKRPH